MWADDPVCRAPPFFLTFRPEGLLAVPYPLMSPLLSTDGHVLVVSARSIWQCLWLAALLCPQKFEVLVLQSQEAGPLGPVWSGVAL